MTRVDSKASPYRYMAWVLLLLVPCFGLWYAAGTLPAAPAFYLCKLLLQWSLPDVVQSISLDGTRMLVLTHFGELDGVVVAAGEAGYQLGFPVDTRLLSYSLPFFAALLFAARVPQPLERFCRGLLVLWLLMALGLFCVSLKNLMLGLGDVLFTDGGGWLPSPQVIAVAYQLSTLIVPTVAPVILWLLLARESELMQRLWSRPTG